MASNAFNNLQYLQDLVEAGVPQEQAEVMAKALVAHTDHLVTREHLDSRFETFEARQDNKFAELGHRIDSLEERIDYKFRYFAFTQAILIGGVFLPLVRSWLS